MGTVKRMYIYIVSLISLSVLSSTVLALIWSLLFETGRAGLAEVGLVSTIIVTLPVYMFHWRWAQRLSEEKKEERESTVRVFYLYIIVAVTNAILLGVVYTFVEVVILQGDTSVELWMLLFGSIEAGAIFYYHKRVIAADNKFLDYEAFPYARRLYWLIYTIAGAITVVSIGVMFLQYIFDYTGEGYLRIRGFYQFQLLPLTFGTIIWAVFWRKMQDKFRTEKEEQASLSRRIYLYVVVFVNMIGTIATVTLVLEGGIKRLMSLPSSGDLSDAIAVIIMTGAFWFYHGMVIREDGEMIEDSAEQSNVRRVYLYIVAGIGFAAFLAGIVGIVNLIIEGFGPRITSLAMKKGFASAVSVLIAGIGMWILPWRTVSTEIEDAGDESAPLRKNMARQIYLYFFVLLSALTDVWVAISIVYWFLSLLFGFGGRLDAIVIADGLIAAAVLVFHGRIIRTDNTVVSKTIADKAQKVKVAILDNGEGTLAAALRDALKEEFDTLQPVMARINVSSKSATLKGGKADNFVSAIKDIDLMVGPWNMVSASVSNAKIANALAANTAHKLLLPITTAGMNWIGVEEWSEKEIVKETIKSVRSYLEGQKETEKTGNRFWRVVGFIAGLITLLYIFGGLLFWILYGIL